MLDSLYEKALKKKKKINDKLNEIESFQEDISKYWVDFPIKESTKEITISGGDGSLKKLNFLSSIFYAIDAECLINSKEGLERVESSEIDIIHHHEHAEDRIRSYMSIFEIKNALKAFETYEIDLYLFDGSIRGNLIRPFPFEQELKKESKEKIILRYAPLLEKELMNSDIEITSLKFSNSLKDENEMIYLENLENLFIVSDFLKKNKIVAISKSSTSKDYFEGSKFPDIAIFDTYTEMEGYSKPIYLKASKSKRDYFPVRADHLKELTFTIFYARLENHKNILKFELPYKETDERKIKTILESVKKISAEGYPILLKKAHNDVVIRSLDLIRLSRIMEFPVKTRKTGREMLWMK